MEANQVTEALSHLQAAMDLRRDSLMDLLNAAVGGDEKVLLDQAEVFSDALTAADRAVAHAAIVTHLSEHPTGEMPPIASQNRGPATAGQPGEGGNE